MFTSLRNSSNYVFRAKISNDMSSSDISKQTFSMPALGRHFSLGTVYDAVRDKTIPGKENKRTLAGWTCRLSRLIRLLTTNYESVLANEAVKYATLVAYINGTA